MFWKQSPTLLSSFVMARESVGIERLRSDKYPSSLFSSSGSGGFSVSSWTGSGADGAGLSLLAVEPSVLPPPSDREETGEVNRIFALIQKKDIEFYKPEGRKEESKRLVPGNIWYFALKTWHTHFQSISLTKSELSYSSISNIFSNLLWQ